MTDSVKIPTIQPWQAL